MNRKSKLKDNPQIELSFSKQNSDLNHQEGKLNIEILRVHTIEKQRNLTALWNLNQEQLCDYFNNYQLFPQKTMKMEQLLHSKRLKLIKTDGKIYFGDVERKRREGKGIYIQQEGKVYEGDFYNNEKNGKGIEIYPNGNLYIGQFQNNKKHGRGKFYWFSLSSRQPKSDEFIQYYDGEWWGGLPDGQGMHQKINGDMFTGVFKNGLKHGEGVEFYGNGESYKGEYVNGMPEGYGQYQWSDGSCYKGDFKQGQRNGYGLWLANKHRKESYKGHFSSDKKAGYGVYQWDNGWIYRGNFENDMRNGYGELYDANEEMNFKGLWQNGEQLVKEAILSNKEKEIDFKSTQLSRFSSKRQQTVNNFDKYQTKSRTSMKVPMNKMDTGQFATLSNFGEFNLCQRPSSNPAMKRVSSTGSQNIRIKETGRIGTSVKRPLMNSPLNSKKLQRIYSSRRY